VLTASAAIHGATILEACNKISALEQRVAELTTKLEGHFALRKH
jgi:hypothetical protein